MEKSKGKVRERNFLMKREKITKINKIYLI